MKARRSYVKITYEGKDITGDLTPYFKGLSYTDNLDKADTASFTLLGDKWIKEWAILKGDRFQIDIGVLNWKHQGDSRVLKCGTFIVDDISFSGAPDMMTVSGNSIDITKDLKGVCRDNTWENISLKEIAQEISERYSMNLFYDCDEEFIYEKIDQVKESDAQLLSRIVKEHGFTIKITSEQLIIFDDKKYEDRETVATFSKEDLTSYEIQCDDLDVYDACEITFYDPILGVQIKGRYEAPASSFYKVRTGKVYYKNVDTGVTGVSKEEKEKYLRERAKKLLRNKNKNETQIRIDQMGDPGYLAGITAKATGFGRYDGIYLITSVTHSLDSGYKCSIAARRRLDF
jgi:phage protein D